MTKAELAEITGKRIAIRPAEYGDQLKDQADRTIGLAIELLKASGSMSPAHPEFNLTSAVGVIKSERKRLIAEAEKAEAEKDG